MRKLKKTYPLICCTAACLLILTNCVNKSDGPDTPGNGGGQEGNKFDYTTTANVKIEVDYSMKGNKALFEVYAQEPVERVNGILKKKEGINSVLKAYTDKDSRFSGVVNLPTDAAKVYLYTESYGLPTCVEAEVISGHIVFDLQDFLAKIEEKHSGKNEVSLSQAQVISTKSTENNPYNIITLGNWTNSGRPYYIEGNKQGSIMVPMCMPTPEGLDSRTQNTLPAGKDNSRYAISTKTININVTRDAQHIILIFLSERASWNNAIGYYYYDTQNPPRTREDFDKLPKYLAFPNCSMYHSASDGFGSYYAPMSPGIMMRMTYYDQNNQPSEIFPGGTTIGWFMLPDAFSVSDAGTGTLDIAGTKHSIRYSNNEFNDNQDKYCVSLYDQPSGKTILGFEDGGDNDYKDVLFYLESDPADAIYDPYKPTTNPDEYPDVTGDPIEGTLAFEDLWPSQGDYDMNDVVIKYSTVFTTNKDNKIIAIQDVFTPLHNGGQLKTAFGYSLDLPASDITSVQIENGSSSAMLTNGLESKQDKAVIMLFDNIQQAVSKGPVTVTLKLKGNQSLNTVTRKSLYNPFICPSVEGFQPGRLRKEVHLTNYAPTQLADLHFFGINDDKSSMDKEGNLTGPYYYGTSDLHPFAIDLPVTDYSIPDETVKIDIFYPQFTEWAKTSGEKNKDWYRRPAKK